MNKAVAAHLDAIYAEGNNGGSYLMLEHTADEGTLLISIGHDRVHVVERREVSVFALCALLAAAWGDRGDGWRAGVAEACGGAIPAWAEPVPERTAASCAQGECQAKARDPVSPCPRCGRRMGDGCGDPG